MTTEVIISTIISTSFGLFGVIGFLYGYYYSLSADYWKKKYYKLKGDDISD